ncbi:MAG: hypothetical protein ACP5G7_02275 [Anaerolineae bacterium]
MIEAAPPTIATYNEGHLHAALKAWYAQPGDRIEEEVAGYRVDIVRDDLLLEVQTGGFSSLAPKIEKLLATHRVRVIYPIAQDKWIVKRYDDGHHTRRLSPKHGIYADLFDELVAMPRLLTHPDLTLEVALVQTEEAREHQPGKAWRRRGWVITGHRLLNVVERRRFRGADDLAELLPDDLPAPFDTADLADALRRGRRLAQRMAYCLRKMRALTPVGKRGRSILYTRSTLLASEEGP